METLINAILANNGYSYNETIKGFQLENKAYFFTQTISSNELEVIKNRFSLDECKWYQSFLSKFNELCRKNEPPSLEKNSSLLILVESTSIKDLERLQSQILLLEEDQFFVKKYIIIYTVTGLSKISELSSNEELQSGINNGQSFEKLMKDGLSEDLEEYLILLQLFIKLPFLKLKSEEDGFVGLQEKLKNVLSTDLRIYEQVLASIEELQKLDFLNIESDTEIDNLQTLLTDDSN